MRCYHYSVCWVYLKFGKIKIVIRGKDTNKALVKGSIRLKKNIRYCYFISTIHAHSLPPPPPGPEPPRPAAPTEFPQAAPSRARPPGIYRLVVLPRQRGKWRGRGEGAAGDPALTCDVRLRGGPGAPRGMGKATWGGGEPSAEGRTEPEARAKKDELRRPQPPQRRPVSLRAGAQMHSNRSPDGASGPLPVPSGSSPTASDHRDRPRTSG